ncbi:response regulator [Phenylobacterium sp.]|uniref:response regulator n=1 Tax=Phenylobacterium sp. TaxID=1871053 RepID=UPI001224C725|nr:response regulator [Phenylobacterium sp.]THD59275.1 MAG: response regulator [Phenylobacterium sp.]
MDLRLKPIVLVVEDEALIRMLAVSAFLDEGFEVLEVKHAAQARDVHGRATQVHLLFTDVSAPGEMNGIELAEELKARAPALQVIITSARPLLRAVDHLPATFVIKPYDAESVCKTGRALLAA